MKILITGSRGFIGSKLKTHFPGAMCLDIADGKNILTCDLPDADIIYHLAAQSSVENSWEDPVHDCDNIKMVVRLVKRYPDSKIIFSQSASIMDVQSPYSFSKKTSGEYLKKFHKNYVSCVIPAVFGIARSVVDIFQNAKAHGKPIEIYGDGEQVRDFVHVDDIVQGLILAQDWPVGEYNLGSGIGTKVLDLLKGQEDKQVIFLPARREQREMILPNTTPNWKPLIAL